MDLLIWDDMGGSEGMGKSQNGWFTVDNLPKIDGLFHGKTWGTSWEYHGKTEDTQERWMVYNGKSPSKMDDFGGTPMT